MLQRTISLSTRRESGQCEFEESDYYLWERPFLGRAVTLTMFTRINRNTAKLDFSSFTELIDIKPEGGDFIHS